MARVSIAILNHRMALELNANVMGAEMSAVDWNIMEHHGTSWNIMFSWGRSFPMAMMITGGYLDL